MSKPVEEIVEDLIFEISSDISCGRASKAVETLHFFLKDNDQVKSILLKSYFSNEYHLNPDMFEITLLLLSTCDFNYRVKSLNKLINRRPLHFKKEQLLTISKELGSDIIISDATPLLLCYLAKDLDKVFLYLSLGYKPENVLCKAIFYGCSSKSSIAAETFHHILKYEPKPEYLGQNLDVVFELENIIIKKYSA